MGLPLTGDITEPKSPDVFTGAGSWSQKKTKHFCMEKLKPGLAFMKNLHLKCNACNLGFNLYNYLSFELEFDF